jgi:hypothetical protein
MAINRLTSRLEELVGVYRVEGATWEENNNSDKSAVNIHIHSRRFSQFLVTPTESL